MSNATYVIPVWDTITTAWEKVHGAKKTFWGAMLLFLAIMFVLGFISGIFDQFGFGQPVRIIANVIGYFMQMGLLYMGIKRAIDQPIEFKQALRVFDTEIALKVVGLYLLQICVFLPVIIVLLGVSYLFSMNSGSILTLLFCVGGIALLYLSIRLLLSNGFVLDKKMNPWDAVKLSFKGTRGNFWPCLCLVLLQIIIMAISAIPFGIGLIWTMPFAFICYGTVYKRLQANLI